MNTNESDVSTAVRPQTFYKARYDEKQFEAMCKEMLNKHFRHGNKESLIEAKTAITFNRLSRIFNVDSVNIIMKKKCKKISVNFLVNGRSKTIAFEPTSNNENKYHF